jgi:hypothetical protein
LLGVGFVVISCRFSVVGRGPALGPVLISVPLLRVASVDRSSTRAHVLVHEPGDCTLDSQSQELRVGCIIF